MIASRSLLERYKSLDAGIHLHLGIRGIPDHFEEWCAWIQATPLSEQHGPTEDGSLGDAQVSALDGSGQGAYRSDDPVLILVREVRQGREVPVPSVIWLVRVDQGSLRIGDTRKIGADSVVKGSRFAPAGELRSSDGIDRKLNRSGVLPLRLATRAYQLSRQVIQSG